MDDNTLLLGWQASAFLLQKDTQQTSSHTPLFSRFFRLDDQKIRSVDVQIPQVSDQNPDAEGFNSYAQDTILPVITQFISDTEELNYPPDSVFQPSSLQIDYLPHWNDAGRLSLLVNVYTYISGAAHPYSYMLTLNYDLANGKALSLQDVFQPDSDYLTFLLNYSENELKQRDNIYMEGSLSADAQHYQFFTFTKQGLALHFEPYHVAAYAAGPQEVIIPYDQLKTFLRAEYMPQTLP